MDVLKEIIENSAIGPLSNGYRGIVLLLFLTIVCTLLIMMVLLILHGSSLTFHYGY